MASKRRTLRQAYKEEPTPGLESFVFGDRDRDRDTTSTPGISFEEATESGAEVIVPTSKIHKTFSFCPDRKPVRYYYDQHELKDWAESDLKVNGIRTALWVRPIANKPGEYELVAGLRRLTACELIGITEIPVKVFDWDDDEAYAAAFDENDRRQNFSKLEETDIILNLLARRLAMGREELVSLLYKMDNQAKGKTTQSTLGNSGTDVIEAFFTARGQLTWKSFVATRLPLLKKPPEILEAIRSSQIDFTKALEISRVKDPEKRSLLLEEAINRKSSLIEVKQRVKELSTVKDKPDLKVRFKSALQQMDKAKVWTDPSKAKELEKLLEQIEKFL